MSSEKSAPARDRILDVAGPLFYREGHRAIGVDRVIEEAGVAKATFYNHFKSKDDLIIAWISRAERMLAASSPGLDVPAPLTAYANAMIDIAHQGGCLGCIYQITAAEFGDVNHPTHAAALAVKDRVLQELTLRAAAQGLAPPRAAAERVFLLLEGIWAVRRMFGPDAPLSHAREAVQRLVQREPGLA